MDNIEIKPLKQADLIDFYNEGLQKHSKGWSIYYKDELVAIVGISIQPTIIIAWSDIKPVKIPKRVVLQTAIVLMDKFKNLGYPTIYAIAKPELKGAPAFLTYLGWEHIESSARGELFMKEFK